jgi:hypothetical protein
MKCGIEGINKCFLVTDEQRELDQKITKTEYRLENATKLTSALSDEHSRCRSALT